MNRFVNRPRNVTVLIALGTLFTWAFLAFHSNPGHAQDKKAAASAPRPALTVAATAPQRAQLPIRLSANGNIAAWQEAIVGAEANGLRITEVRVNVGDRVKKGQVLAVFSGDTLRAEAAQARASLAEAEASAADAAANAQRARSIESTGALSVSQLNQYYTAEKTARSRVEAARALYQVQQVRSSQGQVRAPDDGIISGRTATVGGVAGAGTELFRLIRGARLEWRAEVTATELGRIQPGTAAEVTAASGAKLAGRVRTIGATVDPQTRSALVYVDLQPPPVGSAPGAALPGMFARGEFALGATDALVVPQSALAVRDGFSYLYRINPDGRVQQLKVQTGRLAGNNIEITGGLEAGARIVAAGGGFLADGDLVRVTESTAAPAAAVAPGAVLQPNPQGAQVNRPSVAIK